MQVYTDMDLLLAGIPSTNDGCHILRFAQPVLFEALFNQIPAVSMGFPFTLDTQFATGIRLALVGQLDGEQKLNAMAGHL